MSISGLHCRVVCSDPHGDLSYPKFMIEGSFAGVMEHVCMYPIDTVKMRMQDAERGLSPVRCAVLLVVIDKV